MLLKREYLSVMRLFRFPETAGSAVVLTLLQRTGTAFVPSILVLQHGVRLRRQRVLEGMGFLHSSARAKQITDILCHTLYVLSMGGLLIHLKLWDCHLSALYMYQWRSSMPT